MWNTRWRTHDIAEVRREVLCTLMLGAQRNCPGAPPATFTLELVGRPLAPGHRSFSSLRMSSPRRECPPRIRGPSSRVHASRQERGHRPSITARKATAQVLRPARVTSTLMRGRPVSAGAMRAARSCVRAGNASHRARCPAAPPDSVGPRRTRIPPRAMPSRAPGLRQSAPDSKRTASVLNSPGTPPRHEHLADRTGSSTHSRLTDPLKTGTKVRRRRPAPHSPASELRHTRSPDAPSGRVPQGTAPHRNAATTRNPGARTHAAQ